MASGAMSAYDVVATDGQARAGVLRTAHGDVPTPAFMPVGTKGTVKAVDPEELRVLGAAIVLGNTYHLSFRPGADVVAELGGLHAFMGWDGPILTDSGGFQVFSLRHTLAAVDDEGVTFRSVYDGDLARLTPERAARIQADLGSDVAMCLDVCPPADASRAELEQATSLTTTWAARQRKAPRAPGQLVFGIAQGGSDSNLRRRSIEEIAALDFDGNALGGLSVGEDRQTMFETVGWAAPLLPETKPRYFMGIGDPEGILEVIERGIDMFDCVLPTRPAAAGRRLRLPGLHALQPRVHPPPGQGERAARPAPALTAQPPLPARPDRGGQSRDRTRRPGIVQGRGARSTRPGARGARAGDRVEPLIFIAVMAGLLWLVVIRPQRRRTTEHSAMISTLSVGDEIVTAGGVYG